MAPPIAVDIYVSVVRRSGLVESDRLDEALRELEKESGPPSDSTVVAQRLMDRQLVTPWQNEKLMQGKHKGFLLGKYKLLSYIGAGGMSTVYLGEHLLMRRRVAIKILPTARVNDSSYLDRFHREARAIASLDHINIVRAYNVDNDNNLHYIVMEYVEGSDLERVVIKEGPLSYERAVDYLKQSADGLEHAHTRGMIHRDIKPSNLLLDKEGTIKILDMGLARLTGLEERNLTMEHKENVLGTTDYLAPEQAIDSHNIDARADLYSLGCTLYFLLTGKPPFPDGTLAQRLVKHQTDEPKEINTYRPDVPADLVDICRKMRAKKPANRYASAAELSAVLVEWQKAHGCETKTKRRGGDASVTRLKNTDDSTLSMSGVTQQMMTAAKSMPVEAPPLIDTTRGGSSVSGLSLGANPTGGSMSKIRQGSSVSRASNVGRMSDVGKQSVPIWVWAGAGAGVLAIGLVLFMFMGSGSSSGSKGRTAIKGKGAPETVQVGDYASWSGLPMGSLHELRFTLPSEGNRNLILKTMGGPRDVEGRILLDDRVIHDKFDFGDLNGNREFPLGKHHLRAGVHRLGIDLKPKGKSRPDWVSYDPWHLIGPFPNSGDKGFDTKYPPETEGFKPDAEYDGKKGKVKWTQKNYSDGATHDIKGEFGSNGDDIAYYLYRNVKASKAGKTTFYMGSDDTLTVFVNGQKVHPGRKGGRGLAAYDDTVPVTLKQGDNALLLKICQGGGGTGFFFTDTPSADQPMSGTPLKFGLSFPPAK